MRKAIEHMHEKMMQKRLSTAWNLNAIKAVITFDWPDIFEGNETEQQQKMHVPSITVIWLLKCRCVFECIANRNQKYFGNSICSRRHRRRPCFFFFVGSCVSKHFQFGFIFCVFYLSCVLPFSKIPVIGNDKLVP